MENNIKIDFDKEIAIGVTGHRDIPRVYIPRIEQTVLDLLLQIKAEHQKIRVLSSLAEGADQLCARAALRAGCRLEVPLPMDGAEYRKDFSVEASLEFDRLSSLSADVFIAEPVEPVPAKPGRGFYYRQAAICVVKQASVLIALWDGEKTETSDGAGTYETIKLALERHMEIWQIVTPRENKPYPKNTLAISRV